MANFFIFQQNLYQPKVSITNESNFSDDEFSLEMV
jgi:hypothetical protein